MKKRFLTISLFFVLSSSFSQEITPNDGLRYAMDNLTGTARFRAMSGAFGAVGGDLSALTVNPAGSAVFNYNQATLTLSSINIRNSSTYFGTNTIENDYDLDLNQAGVVFVFKNQNTANEWNKFSLALNYENNSNFDNEIYTRGVNPFNSIDNYFLRFANGLPNEGGIFLDVLQNEFFDNLNFIDQQAVLGYEAYLLNPVDEENPNNTEYVSNVPTDGNYYHENYTVSNGYNGKVTGNIATAYKDRLFIGLNLNSHFTDLTTTTSIYESYDTDPTTGLQSVQFDTETYTFGNGFSFGFGVIGKVTESFRLGLAYESPTWYRLTDQQTQRVIAYCPDCSFNNPIIFNPGITFEYDSYKIQTSSKWTGSFAYVFGEKGLISLDYSMKDYSATTFRPRNDSYLESINDYTSATMDVAAEIRVGGEYKYKKWSFRGGYRFEESPYKVDVMLGDLTGYSGGIGFDLGESRIDLAYAYSRRKMNFALISSGMNDPSRLTAINNNVSLSYTMKF